MLPRKLSPDDFDDLNEFLYQLDHKFGRVQLRDLVSDIMAHSIATCTAIDVIDQFSDSLEKFDDNITKTVLINFLKLCSTHRPLVKYLLYLSHRYGDAIAGITDSQN